MHLKVQEVYVELHNTYNFQTKFEQASERDK